MTSLTQAHQLLKVSPATDSAFFSAWYENLPSLSEQEKQLLDRYRDRYFYYAEDGAISEGTVNLIMIAPLLELLKLYDSPYKIRSEEPVRITLADEETVLQGVIDAVVVHQAFWVIIIEAKPYGFNVSLAVPQALAYMSGSSEPTVRYGLVTNGEDYLFIKLDCETLQYGLSRKFTLSNPQHNELREVVSVMKQLLQQLNTQSGLPTP
ncbi:MAG: type I restriction endonuclease subunit R [Cyanobacteria bacterium J06639_14]